MMRRLIWLTVTVALLWTAWWFGAARVTQEGIGQWFEDRRAEGWQADAGALSVTGFPLSFSAHLAYSELADPETGVAFFAEGLTLTTPAWWPGYLTLDLPPSGISLSTPFERFWLQAVEGQAKLSLRPGTDLTMQQMAASSEAWSVKSKGGILWGADGLNLLILQDEQRAQTYHFSADAPAFQLGDATRRKARIPDDWPRAFDSLQLDMTVGFDRTIDRRTIEERRPQPQQVEVRLAEAIWGALSLRFAAALDVATDGRLTGDVSVQARNWRTLLDMTENTGTLPSNLRPQIENVFEALARGGGNPEALELQITIKDGQMFIGFIPLGPAPRLIVR